MKYLTIQHDTQTENLGGAVEGDEWSRDSTRSYYSVKSAYISSCLSGSVPISDCAVGDNVYVVWADYTTGDTFGSDSAIEFLAAFKDVEKAEACAARATNHSEKNTHNDDKHEGWDIHVTLDGGEEYRLHIPWLGYFESLGRAHVDLVRVKG